ncbi:MAG: RNA-binding protein [Pedobacter sp.]
MVKIFIGGFPLNIQEIELAQLVSIYGEVLTVKIVRDKITGLCKGYGFIEMTSLEGAKNAIEALNGNQMGKRALFLNLVTDLAINSEIKKGSKLSSPLSVIKVETGSVKRKRPRIISNH